MVITIIYYNKYNYVYHGDQCSFVTARHAVNAIDNCIVK